ncbi:SAM-dependent methyltransferase [Streptomyces mirabilis]|uniref:SAM-dependent methyltransferase n=2 Tax=Streptomyces mirabilis TaxID=68239 RepID=UPI0036DA9CE1
MVAMTYEGSSIDPAKPSIARVYDYLLGGKDNYAVDREIGDVFKRDLPGSVAIAFANRAALTRAVREIAKTTGIRQFIDLGSGLPTADNVHQVAQRHAPESRVVYVDIDPQVLVHGRALLENNDRTRVVAVDVRNPEGIHTHPDTLEIIDFTRPVAVILSAILHHVNDDEDPAGIVRYWRDHVPSGSYFFITTVGLMSRRAGPSRLAKPRTPRLPVAGGHKADALTVKSVAPDQSDDIDKLPCRRTVPTVIDRQAIRRPTAFHAVAVAVPPCHATVRRALPTTFANSSADSGVRR